MIHVLSAAHSSKGGMKKFRICVIKGPTLPIHSRRKKRLKERGDKRESNHAR